jgi:hypothetical protein
MRHSGFNPEKFSGHALPGATPERSGPRNWGQVSAANKATGRRSNNARMMHLMPRAAGQRQEI